MADLPATLAPLQVTGNAKGRLVFCPSVASTPGSPRAYVRVGRWLASTGEWKTLAKLMLPGTAATSASYVDSSTIKDDRVRYGMRIINQGGTQQESVHSSTLADAWQLAATPPIIGMVRRVAPDKIRISYYQRSRAAVNIMWLVETSADKGKTWSSRSVAASIAAPAYSAGRTVYTYDLTVNPLLYYRVGARAQTVIPVPQVSGDAMSPSVISAGGVPPMPPSQRGPYADRLPGKVAFGWTHRPVAADGTAQTGAQVEYRPVGGATTTLTLANDDQDWIESTATFGVGSYEWRARTKGVSGEYGPWSGWVTFVVTTAPSITISSPDEGQTVVTNRPSIGVDWYSPSGSSIATWGARLKQGATVLESKSGKGAVTSIRFARALADGQSYTVEVWATASNGLASATDTVTFPVAYTRPPVPVVTLARWWADDGYVGVVATYSTGTAATAIERSLDGEAWTRVQTGPGGTGGIGLQDPLAPSGLVGVLYRAVAISSLGAESYSTPVAVTTRPANDVWLVGADGTRCRIRSIGALDPGIGQDVVLEQYYGHEKPTAHYGDGRPVKIGISGTLRRGEGLEDDWLALLGQPVHYRDPDGRHGWGTLDATGIAHPGSTWTEQRPIAATWEATTYDPEDDD